MVRTKKTEVSRVRDPKYGIDLPLYVDRETKQFWCEVGEQRIEGMTGHDVETRALAAARATLSVTWEPVIGIEISPRMGDAEEAEQSSFTASLTVRRRWMARYPDGRWRRAAWLPPAPNLRDGPDTNAARMRRAAVLNGDADYHAAYAIPRYPPPPPAAGRRWDWSDTVRDREIVLPYDDDLWDLLGAGSMRALRAVERILQQPAPEAALRRLTGLLGAVP